MPITIYPGTVKKRNLNGTYSDLVPGADANPQIANDIAEEYDPVAGVYSVGDYCIYQSVFYKCITAISTPEAFDSTKWADISVAEELTSQKNTLNSVENGLAIIVDGDTCSTAVPVGGYAYIKNNTHGLAEGLYTNTSASAFPTSGGTANSSIFTAVPGGGLNTLNTKLAWYNSISYNVTGGLLPLYVTQIQNILFLQALYINPSQAIAEGDWVTLGFLPEGHRPSSTIYAGDTFVDGDGEVYGFRCNVLTDGKLYARFKKAISTSTSLFGTVPIIIT